MHKKSIELLNQAIGDELAAVHQYMYWHFHCDDQGFDLLAGLFKRTAIEEMVHIERLAERILFLKGDVEMTASDPVQKERDVEKMLMEAERTEEEPTTEISFAAGDRVRIKEGLFQNFDGEIEEIWPEKGQVRVIVSILGRPTPVELEYWQLESI